MSSIKKTGFFKTSDKVPLYYELHGPSKKTKSAAMVFTPGLACPINHWHHQLEFFSQNHRCLVYDLRGHGQSEMGPAENLSLERLAQDTLELSQSLFPNEKLFFLGHSFGVPISIKVAALNPELTRGLFLINGFYKNPFEKWVSREKIFSAFETLEESFEAAPQLISWIWRHSANNELFRIGAGLTGGFNLERVQYKDIEIYTQGLSQLPFLNFVRHFKALMRYDGSQDIKTLSKCTWVLHGAKDGIVPKSQNLEIASSGQFLEFEEGSHCTQLDLPFQTNNAILKGINQACSI